jgi:hypothetical protein
MFIVIEFSIHLIVAAKANSSHTIGVEFGSKVVTMGNRTVKLQIWASFIYLDFFLYSIHCATFLVI